ncbi:3-octaprenyl-4-hydroxybenzoate carboxy-lyase [Campylobacter sp. MIT 99-7217]|uniref:UbiX family flavin prenyltransferase n=1 Tax=Campylobacter sp. MIT 99-7217 TaxID=535091 RepID=UPI00115A459E|nr:UbiX family flavin prenyltransferase [Campylobacter sp. MIT 99-7217]TQR34447.1 3-octaprenyl-4-hydroxybenzoate carboxy-lyase [Campylobacter sp. MIT 99-7217]
MKILVGITGSSSVELGFRLLAVLEKKAEVFCIVSKGAKKSFLAENKHFNAQDDMLEFCKKHFQIKQMTFLDDEDLSAGASSGSFGIDKTIIAPCSISTLAKIHAGFADSLLTRACAVALKERKTLILGVREMPFSTISLEHMTKLSTLGVSIAPPIFASYAQIRSLEDEYNFIVGKWLDLLQIQHNLFEKWNN